MATTADNLDKGCPYYRVEYYIIIKLITLMAVD